MKAVATSLILLAMTGCASHPAAIGPHPAVNEPTRAAAWFALGRRVAELRDRRIAGEPAAPIAKVLRRGTSSVLVLARTMEVFEQAYELARTVGCAIVLVSLPREGELLPVIARSPTDRVAERRS